MQDQFYLLAEIKYCCFVDALPLVYNVHSAKKKWPAQWGGWLGGKIR